MFSASCPLLASPSVRTMHGISGVVFVQFCCTNNSLQCPEPPPGRRDRVHAGLVQNGPHGDGTELRPPRDLLGQFLDRHARLDVAHVRLAEH